LSDRANFKRLYEFSRRPRMASAGKKIL